MRLCVVTAFMGCVATVTLWWLARTTLLDGKAALLEHDFYVTVGCDELRLSVYRDETVDHEVRPRDGPLFFISRDPDYFVQIPSWIPVAISSVILAMMLVLARVGRRVSETACSACRYDLTGNVSGKCPECGAVVPEKLVLVQGDEGPGHDSRIGPHDEQAEPES